MLTGTSFGGGMVGDVGGEDGVGDEDIVLVLPCACV